MPPLPANFVNLATAAETRDQLVNLMGVVVDYLPLRKSMGTDFSITFTLHDPSWNAGLGLKFRMFHKEEKRLPMIRSCGDVVLLRNVKIKTFQGSLIGSSIYATSWMVFPGASIPEGDTTAAVKNPSVEKLITTLNPSEAETSYAFAICNSEVRAGFATPASIPVTCLQDAKPREKFSLLQDLLVPRDGEPKVFADLLGEVRKSYSNDFRVDLSISDYTTNKRLYNFVHSPGDDGADGDEYGYMSDKQRVWPGPWGQMTITVALWDEHATEARKSVKQGDFVLLQNVNVVMGKDGRSMEGKLRGDTQYGSKLRVTVFKAREAEGNDRMAALLKRKRAYELEAKRRNLPFIRDPSQKTKAAVTKVEQPQRGPNKNNAKNKRKKAADMEVDSERAASVSGSACDSNSYVRCNKVEVPLTPIDEIMSLDILRRKTTEGNDYLLPFQNCCYHSKVRIVDYYPDKIADFAAPSRQSDYEILSDYEQSSSSEMEIDDVNGEPVRWEWRFMLLVEDARLPTRDPRPREQMKLLVAEQDGDYLLNMEASNLHDDAKTLAMVKEKLFVLWGDLQERKEAGEERTERSRSRPLAKPFECLIKEYGAQCRVVKKPVEYERCFRLWGTTIK